MVNSTSNYPKSYPDSILGDLNALEPLLRETHSLARRIREQPGIRSKIFGQSSTGQALIGKDRPLDRSLDLFLVLSEHIRAQADDLAIGRFAKLLANAISKGRPIVCVLAPMFTDENVTDGYFRRIKNVDDLIPSGCFRVYLHYERMIRSVTLQEYDESHVCLNYGPEDDLRPLFESIATHACLVYAHSIHRFDGRFFECCPQSTPFILDFHGAVPEELAYASETDDVIHMFEAAEQQAVLRANVIICVSENMIDHIGIKYPNESKNTKFIIMPILDVDESRREKAVHQECMVHGQKPVVIYAGGTQKWQMIDKMLDAVESQRESCSYRLFVPNTAQLDGLWGNRAKPNDLIIGTKTPEELVEEYRECQYGFILREDCTVNNVACPTKLAEYLRNDVIPIVSSPAIGDFARKGMRFVTLDDFIQGQLPDWNAQRTMAEANRSVIEEIECDFMQGRSQLCELFALYVHPANAAVEAS